MAMMVATGAVFRFEVFEERRWCEADQKAAAERIDVSCAKTNNRGPFQSKARVGCRRRKMSKEHTRLTARKGFPEKAAGECFANPKGSAWTSRRSDFRPRKAAGAEPRGRLRSGPGRGEARSRRDTRKSGE